VAIVLDRRGRPGRRGHPDREARDERRATVRRAPLGRIDPDDPAAVLDRVVAKRAGRAGFGEMIRFLRKTPSCRVILAAKTDRPYRTRPTKSP
jgi:hypothetical protein